MDQTIFDWFDSPEYLSVYQHRNEAEANILADTLLTVIKPRYGSSLLDLACGAGRHTIAFGKRGLLVTGIDISESLINNASRMAARENVKAVFVHGDLYQLDTHIQYDMVVNLFSSFGYSIDDDDNFRLFPLAFGVLREGGYFVFDFLNAANVITTLIPYSFLEVDGMYVDQYRTIESGMVIKCIVIQNDHSLKRFREQIKLYSPDVLRRELTNAGFVIEHQLGDYHGSSFDENSSQRFIAVCRK